jgi:hypothetical protein
MRFVVIPAKAGIQPWGEDEAALWDRGGGIERPEPDRVVVSWMVAFATMARLVEDPSISLQNEEQGT